MTLDVSVITISIALYFLSLSHSLELIPMSSAASSHQAPPPLWPLRTSGPLQPVFLEQGVVRSPAQTFPSTPSSSRSSSHFPRSTQPLCDWACSCLVLLLPPSRCSSSISSHLSMFLSAQSPLPSQLSIPPLSSKPVIKHHLILGAVPDRQISTCSGSGTQAPPQPPLI